MDFTLLSGLIEFKATGVPEIDNAVKHVNDSLKGLGSALGGLNLSGIGSAFGTASGHLAKMLDMGKSLGLNITEGLTSAFTSVAPQLATILATPIVGQIAAGVTAALALVAMGIGRDREHSKFDTLTGGREQTEKMMEDIKKNFLGTDVDVEQMKGMTKEMLAAGMSVEDITSRLKSLGNVSLATGSSVGGMQKALECMEATGKISNRTLMAFGLGFELEMAKHRGVSMSTLRAQASSGILKASDIKAEVDRQGAEGSKGDQIRIAELNDVMGQLARMSEAILNPFKKLGEFLIHALNLGGALGVVNSIIGVFGSAVKGVIAALEPVAVVISAVLEPIWITLAAGFTLVGDVLKHFGELIGWLLDPLVDLVNIVKWSIDKLAGDNRKLASFTEDEKKEAHKEEASWGGVGKLGREYVQSLQDAAGYSAFDRATNFESMDELEKKVAKHKEEGHKAEEEGTQGGGTISISGMWEKIQDAALKQNTDQAQLEEAKKANEHLEAIKRSVEHGPFKAHGDKTIPKWIRNG